MTGKLITPFFREREACQISKFLDKKMVRFFFKQANSLGLSIGTTDGRRYTDIGCFFGRWAVKIHGSAFLIGWVAIVVNGS